MVTRVILAWIYRYFVNTGRSFSEEATLERELYLSDGYFTPRRWIGFCGQVNAVRKVAPSTLLEIGVGNGIVHQILLHMGVAATSFDINPHLNPDITGNLLAIGESVQAGSYDCVLCAEVLEHLPFALFDQCLENIAYATRKHAIVTLPRTGNLFHAVVNLPKIKPLDMLFQVPMPYVPKGHHWEIDSAGYSRLARIIEHMEKFFTVKEYYRFPHEPKIYAFILEKK